MRTRNRAGRQTAGSILGVGVSLKQATRVRKWQRKDLVTCPSKTEALRRKLLLLRELTVVVSGWRLLTEVHPEGFEPPTPGSEGQRLDSENSDPKSWAQRCLRCLRNASRLSTHVQILQGFARFARGSVTVSVTLPQWMPRRIQNIQTLLTASTDSVRIMNHQRLVAVVRDTAGQVLPSRCPKPHRPARRFPPTRIVRQLDKLWIVQHARHAPSPSDSRPLRHSISPGDDGPVLHHRFVEQVVSILSSRIQTISEQYRPWGFLSANILFARCTGESPFSYQIQFSKIPSAPSSGSVI
jgi:hypothetical protein